jgi:GNAT superfamily N-acetyltransferase
MAGELTIRLARPDERAALEALQMRASLEWEDQRADLLANPDAVDLPTEQITGGFVFVAERDGAVVGFSVVLPRADGQAELDGLFVEPGVWGGGLGRRLTDAAADKARAFGAKRMYVIANPNAEGFYVRCGFSLDGTAQTRFGPANTMVKPLA